MYAPRDLYRPGETVDLSAILRNRDGMPESVKHLNLRLIRPDAKLFLEENVAAKDIELGYFHYRFRVPDGAPTGGWRAEFRITSKDKTPAISFNFHVEEFLPERMKLALKAEKEVIFQVLEFLCHLGVSKLPRDLFHRRTHEFFFLCL